MTYGRTMRRAHVHNIAAQLFTIALPHMRAYQSDLGHDAVFLSKVREGGVYLWAYREMGTHFCRPEDLRHYESYVPARNWWLIQVDKLHEVGGCAEGDMTFVGADSYDQVRQNVEDALKDRRVVQAWTVHNILNPLPQEVSA